MTLPTTTRQYSYPDQVRIASVLVVFGVQVDLDGAPYLDHFFQRPRHQKGAGEPSKGERGPREDLCGILAGIFSVSCGVRNTHESQYRDISIASGKYPRACVAILSY